MCGLSKSGFAFQPCSYVRSRPEIGYYLKKNGEIIDSIKIAVIGNEKNLAPEFNQALQYYQQKHNLPYGEVLAGGWECCIMGDRYEVEQAFSYHQK